jgi:hypothetical protein
MLPFDGPGQRQQAALESFAASGHHRNHGDTGLLTVHALRGWFIHDTALRYPDS